MTAWYYEAGFGSAISRCEAKPRAAAPMSEPIGLWGQRISQNLGLSGRGRSPRDLAALPLTGAVAEASERRR